MDLRGTRTGSVEEELDPISTSRVGIGMFEWYTVGSFTCSWFRGTSSSSDHEFLFWGGQQQQLLWR